MSRFFRSGESSSSSSYPESITSEDEDGANKVDEQVSAATVDFGDLSTGAVGRSTVGQRQDHRDFLLHALLEERCMNEVLASQDGPLNQRHSPEIQAQANARYQQLCDRLAPFNLISAGLEADRHVATRRRYREGLDYLSRPSTTTRVTPTLRRLLTDTEAGNVWDTGTYDALPRASYGEKTSHLPRLPYQYRRLLASAEAQHRQVDAFSRVAPAFRHALGIRAPLHATSMIESRYHSEFEELSTLGRGGFGSVFHVRHRLDNQAYAIKKVPLSANHMRRIQEHGEPALEELLRELRTLARLDHPNIVRYHTGWLEWTEYPTVHALSSSIENDLGESVQEAVLGAADDSMAGSFQRVLTESESDGAVVFEHSSTESVEGVIGQEQFTTNVSSVDHELQLRRSGGTKSTIAIVSDEDVESIDRSVEPSASIASTTDSKNVALPALVLHMQMSLHPLSLADFLSPPTSNGGLSAAPPLTHCFHLAPSISIMLALVDGIEHLHNEGIIHRDVKPSNIFMGPVGRTRHLGSSVDLQLCSACHDHGEPSPIKLEVRIGDFGLVTFTKQDKSWLEHREDVGTEIYRPATRMAHSPSLDIYALGIIMFELLWPFNTRMERLHCIQQLKEAQLPANFAEKFGDKPAAKVSEFIQAMLSSSGDAVCIQDLKQMLKSIRSIEPRI